jgi:hypothetical protein
MPLSAGPARESERIASSAFSARSACSGSSTSLDDISDLPKLLVTPAAIRWSAADRLADVTEIAKYQLQCQRRDVALQFFGKGIRHQDVLIGADASFEPVRTG